MGQVALGLRSLAIKLAIFVVMAALLAWALGGTLLPRANAAEIGSLTWSGRTCFWRLEVGGKPELRVRWILTERGDGQRGPGKPLDPRVWAEGVGPVAGGDLYYGGRLPDEWGRWRLERLVAGTDPPETVATFDAKYDLEIELARIGRGLPVRSEAERTADAERLFSPAD